MHKGGGCVGRRGSSWYLVSRRLWPLLHDADAYGSRGVGWRLRRLFWLRKGSDWWEFEGSEGQEPWEGREAWKGQLSAVESICQPGIDQIGADSISFLEHV